MAGPDCLAGGRRKADFVHDGACVPWFAHAEPVHVPDPHVGHHLGRRYRDDLGVAHGVDAVGPQPVIQPHGMGARGKGLGEGVFALGGFHELSERFAIAYALGLEFVGNRDGLAVLVQAHQHRHVFARPAYAELHAIDEAVQHVREVQLAVDELVPHAWPRSFFDGCDLDAVLLVQAEHGRHDDRGAVGKRNEADLDFRLFGRVRSGRPGAGPHHGIDQAHDAGRRAGAQQPAASRIGGTRGRSRDRRTVGRGIQFHPALQAKKKRPAR